MVRISRSVAVWLITYAKRIVDNGLGTDWDPYSPEHMIESEAFGFIEAVDPADVPLWDFINAAINLARTLAGILANAVLEDVEEISAISSTFDELGEL